MLKKRNTKIDLVDHYLDIKNKLYFSVCITTILIIFDISINTILS